MKSTKFLRQQSKAKHLLRWPWLKLFVVEGDSMQPALKPGALILGSALPAPKLGRIVIVNRSPVSVKRVKDIVDNQYWVEGDNEAASIDSRSYGYVDRSDIAAIVLLKLFS